MKQILTLISVLFAVFLLAGCTTPDKIDDGGIEVPIEDPKVFNLQDGIEKDELKQINSEEELFELILKSSNDNSLQINKFARTVNTFGGAEMAFADASESFDGGSGSVSQDFSQTNVQVQGVDEADITKTDGKYLYTISQNKVIILDAFPAEDSKIISQIKFEKDETLQELYIQDEKLIVISQGYIEQLKVSKNSLLPQPHYEQQTKVYIYSTQDKVNPTLLKEYSVTGSYFDSRLIDDYVYFISKENLNYYGDVSIPTLYKDGLRIAQPDIFYFNFNRESVFHTISSVSLNNVDLYNSESYLLGYDSTLYVSEENIYIAYKKVFEENIVERFEETVLPAIDDDRKGIFQKHISKNDKEAIAITLEEYFNSLDEKEQEDFRDGVQKRYEEYQDKISAERRKTSIHKFNVDDGIIYYLSQGEVDGHLLNQFSLDENDKGELRVATTKSYWIRGEGTHSYSNVYVLDEKLEFMGWIERLAEDERIYSTRFIGDKLYMVTFKQVDPLFVIDLSISEQPRVLGELKIPGFSTYLHPYGENYLIGFGKETKENDFGGFETIGLKLSLFDISDFENPKEVDKYIIEGRWSESLASHDHKAFMFSPAHQIISIPVIQDLSKDYYDYGNREYFNGAYVFNINENGFELNGKLTHSTNDEDYYWYNSPDAIQRTLYLDDNLYTVSESKVLINSIEDLDEIKEVDLGYEEENYNYPYYYDDVISIQPAILE